MSKNKVTKRQVNIKKGQRYIPKGFPQTDAGWEDYLELCGNLQNFAYNKDTSADPDFDTKGYQQLKEYSNIRYRVFVNPKTKHGIVVYRGTDFSSGEDVKADTYIARGTQDNSTAFQEAEALFRRVTQANKGIKFDTTGHSLGGGKAIYITTKFQDVHAMAFNPGLTPPSIAKYRKKGGDFDPSKCLVIRNTSDPVSHAFIRYNMSATTWDKHNINRVSYANPSQASNIPGRLLDDHGSAQFTKGQTREQSLKDGEEYYYYNEYDGKKHYFDIHQTVSGGGGGAKGIKNLMKFRKAYFDKFFGKGEGPPPPEELDMFDKDNAILDLLDEDIYRSYDEDNAVLDELDKDIYPDEDIDPIDEKYADSGFDEDIDVIDEAPERPSILDDPALNEPEELVAEGPSGSYGTIPEEAVLEEGLFDVELTSAEGGLSFVESFLEAVEATSIGVAAGLAMGQSQDSLPIDPEYIQPNGETDFFNTPQDDGPHSFNNPQHYFDYVHSIYKHSDVRDKFTFKEFVRDYGGQTIISRRHPFDKLYMKGLNKKIFGTSQMSMKQYLMSDAPSNAYFEALRYYEANKGDHALRDIVHKYNAEKLLKEYQLQNAIRYSMRVPETITAKANGKFVTYNLKNLSAPGALVPYLSPEVQRLLDLYQQTDFNKYQERDFTNYKTFIEKKHQPSHNGKLIVPIPYLTQEKRKAWDEASWSFAEKALLDNYAPYRAYRQEKHMQTAMEKVGKNSIEENPSKRQKTQPSMSNNNVGGIPWTNERYGGFILNKDTGDPMPYHNVPRPSTTAKKKVIDGSEDYRPPHNFTPHPGATPEMGEHIDKDESKFLQIRRNMIHDEIIQKGGAGRFNDGRNPHQGSFGLNGAHIEEMGADLNYHNYDATNPHQHFGEAVPSGNLKASSYQQYFKRPAKGSTLHTNVGLAIAADFAASVAQQRADAIGY